MRHRKKGRKLNRTAAHRKALMRNLCSALIAHGQIETTEAKAKELRRYIEPLVTRAKRDQSVHARRMVARWVPDRALIKKLFDEIAPRYANRPGGYTRVVKTGHRVGDAAPLAIIEFVDLPSD